ncbi:MAG TPA: hypothetical protein EYP14_08305, partial [Planctomycetaceae bacterium]|nr:hypothetical protein [Planctomycetaceae bacterium]
RFKFTGREYDAETALYYYRARYYDAAIVRFLSEDPIGLQAGDANLYRYVGNTPTSSTDPHGLRRAVTDDERRLESLVADDPELLAAVRELFDVLDSTWVFPLWPNRCHAWSDEFMSRFYVRMPYQHQLSLRIHYVTPAYTGLLAGVERPWRDNN